MGISGDFPVADGVAGRRIERIKLGAVPLQSHKMPGLYYLTKASK
jgi:hypothetical protein